MKNKSRGSDGINDQENLEKALCNMSQDIDKMMNNCCKDTCDLILNIISAKLDDSIRAGFITKDEANEILKNYNYALIAIMNTAYPDLDEKIDKMINEEAEKQKSNRLI